MSRSWHGHEAGPTQVKRLAVAAQAGRALVRRAGYLFRKPGQLEGDTEFARPRDHETTNRYDENDGANCLLHELALGIEICSGSEGWAAGSADREHNRKRAGAALAQTRPCHAARVKGLGSCRDVPTKFHTASG